MLSIYAMYFAERLALDPRIRSVARPRQGKLTTAQQRAAFRSAYRWRAGIEGRHRRTFKLQWVMIPAHRSTVGAGQVAIRIVCRTR